MLDKVDDAIAAAAAPVHRRIRVDANLTDGRQIVLALPHPFTADDFESTVVMLMNARAQSDEQVKHDRGGIIVPDTKPKLVVP